MRQNQHLRVLDADPEGAADGDSPAQAVQTDSATDAADGPGATLATVYDDADDFDPGEMHSHYSFPRFLTAVCERAGLDGTAADARRVDAIDDPDDVDFGYLLAFPDETLMFVGSDPTANDSVPWFAFTIARHEPVPAPDTAAAALDRLRTPEVRDLVAEKDFLPPRHGEWWLVPCQLVPGGTVFTPGVASTPYGPSPLGNHVPREYAFTVSDDTFMQRFREGAPTAPDTVATPPEALQWTWRQRRKADPPEGTPSWADIRAFGEEVLVRGTIRHREADHFVENVGDVWHRAETHDVEVYTGDQVAADVHLDYHGRG